MKRYRFVGMTVGVHSEDPFPFFGLPRGFMPEKNGDGGADLLVKLRVGNMDEAEVEGPLSIRRGVLTAKGSLDHLVWSHDELGPVIDVYPRKGQVTVSLPSWAWARVTNLFHQLLLPGMIPALAARGVRAVHASVVEAQGNAVVIAGPSGSGKTTAALLLAAEGMGKLVADDLAFLHWSERGPRVHGLLDGVRAYPDTWARFPHMRPKTIRGEKLWLSPDELPWTPSARPRAMILLGGDEEEGPREMDPREALPRLLAYAYHAGDESGAMKSLARLAEMVPVVSASGAEAAATVARSWLGAGERT